MFRSSSRGVAGSSHKGRRRLLTSLAGVGVLAAVAVPVALPAASQAAPNTSWQASSSFTPQAPSLATITGSAGNPAPWDEWQGDSAAGTAPNATATISGNGASVINPLQLLPTYEPGEANGTLSADYPNVSVFGAASNTDSDTSIPYEEGTVGTPGALTGYCGSGDWDAESGLNWANGVAGSVAPSVSTQPVGETLPLGPEYFPHVVLNSDGTLTGYFDYRPKDENEAVLVATSTDGGQDWTYQGTYLQQDAGYCASSDTNDDGQGHPNVLNFDPSSVNTANDISTGGTNDLFTLQRPAGDDDGVGMLVHNLSGSSESDPASNLPSSQPVGIDPDAFAESSTVVAPSSADAPVSITVNTTGYAGTINQLIAGGFVDLGSGASPSYGNATAGNVITCTGVTPSADPTEGAELAAGVSPTSPAQNTYGTLTGCTTNGTGSVTVTSGDLIEQVLGYVSAQTPTSSGSSTTTAGSGNATFPITIPAGPNTETGDGGYAQVDVSPSAADAASGSASADLGFTNELSGQQLNLNAPNRVYVDGTAVYCVQGNNNPTTEIENCTTGSGGSALAGVQVGAPIIGDPITPENTSITTGLVAPDGIVGELQNGFPTAAGATAPPANATYVMYTQKELNYFVAGEVAKKGTFGTAGSSKTFTIEFFPWNYLSKDLASQITTSGSGDSETFGAGSAGIVFTLGDATTGGYDQVKCTTAADTSGGTNGTAYAYGASGAEMDYLSGCSIQSATTSAGVPVSSVSSLYGDAIGKNSMLAAPGAALESPAQLQQTGEGKSASSATNAEKLYSNNEDLAVIRVAWTTDGVNYYDSDLENDGVISGSDTSSVAATAGTPSGIGAGTGTIAAGSDGQCTADSTYTDLTSPYTECNPVSGGAVDLDEYASAGTTDATEQRWPGSAGSIIYNAQTGEYELFLSGAWGGDGDSDAFNQVWYATSTNGYTWSAPQSVVSTDYSFSASAAQNASLANGQDAPLGISAYYSGRAYGPSVVPNPDGGGLLMIFAGYNIPKGAGTDGTVLGTNSSDPFVLGEGEATGASAYSALPNGGEPSAYRNILVDTLDENDGATITVTAPSGAVYGGSGQLSATSGSNTAITYSVDSSSGSGVCSVSGDTVSYTGAGNCVIDASQPAGDGYADAGSGQASFTVAPVTVTVTAGGTSVYGAATDPTATYKGFVGTDSASSLTAQASCTTTATASSPVGSYTATCSGASDPNYTFDYVSGAYTVTPASLTITPTPTTIVFGQHVPTIAPEYAGFVNKDTASSLTRKATCSTTVTSDSAPGSYSSTCAGAADPNYTISYDTGTVTVVQAPSQTSLFTWPTTLTTQDPVILEISVGAERIPTGTVTIYEDGKAVERVPLFFGEGLVILPPLSTGTHQLYAVYSGDTDFASSTSSKVTITVTAPPRIHLGF